MGFTFPVLEWERVSPAEAGYNASKLAGARRWLDERVGEGRYRVVIVRGGRVVAEWNRTNFKLHPRARIHIFGYYDGLACTALDMARLGWLWRTGGRWGDKQLIPAAWLAEATRVAPDIRANCPREQWQYGYGFWTNEYGLIWPSLPRDAYAASGAGQQHIWVCPSLDMVVVQSPGLYEKQHDNDTGLLRLVVDSLT